MCGFRMLLELQTFKDWFFLITLLTGGACRSLRFWGRSEGGDVLSEGGDE